MLRPLGFYLSLWNKSQFSKENETKNGGPPGGERGGSPITALCWLVMGDHPLSPPEGPPFLLSFSLENCDQPSRLVVSTVYYASNFSILPRLRLGKIKKALVK